MTLIKACMATLMTMVVLVSCLLFPPLCILLLIGGLMWMFFLMFDTFKKEEE